MIELQNLKLVVAKGTCDEKTILNGIDLKIAKSEFITVVGTNGAGKSSLMNSISGECRLTEGVIKIHNQEVQQLSVEQRSHWIARVFQDPLAGTCAELTIEENMAMAFTRGSRRGFTRAITSSLREKFKEALAEIGLGLEERLSARMNQLSGGQRQAVSLMMATLSPVEILLLDEHTAALDPKTASSIMLLTDRLVRERGLTVLMITHSLSQALQFGTRTILLSEGKVLEDISGPQREVLTVSDLLEKLG